MRAACEDWIRQRCPAGCMCAWRVRHKPVPESEITALSDEQEAASESTLADQKRFLDLVRETDEFFDGENPEAKLETGLPYELAVFINAMKAKGTLTTTLEPLISEGDVPAGIQAASCLLLKEGHAGAEEFLHRHSEDFGVEGGNARLALMAWKHTKDRVDSQDSAEGISE
ncbi:hypothetical protein A4R44_08697 [Amycolatopsis sp. M39]|nr:hypothetical protein A4R44_08697 [Amycolatopsis sp. M39]